MKIEYDKNLFREIANFRVNDIVQVSNRKGRRSTIHIVNILELSWEQLQLLVSDGDDSFTKRVLLYRDYVGGRGISESRINGKRLAPNEVREINEYMKIFNDYGCSEHHQVNEVIGRNGAWDRFQTIRSLNDHGEYKEIEGIQPKYFEIICEILKISGGFGRPLDRYKRY